MLVSCQACFRPGLYYQVRNIATGESPQFEVVEVLEHQGASIVYGHTLEHVIDTGRKRREIVGRATAFPVFPGLLAEYAAELVQSLGGVPLVISLDPVGSHHLGAIKPTIGNYQVMVNMSQALADLWVGTNVVNPKDRVLLKARKQVWLFLEWGRLGHAPQWLLDDLKTAKAAKAP